MRPTTHALFLTFALVGLMTLGGYLADQLLRAEAGWSTLAPPPAPAPTDVAE